jgi:hypothetical protein
MRAMPGCALRRLDGALGTAERPGTAPDDPLRLVTEGDSETSASLAAFQPATRALVATLRARGIVVLGPTSCPLGDGFVIEAPSSDPRLDVAHTAPGVELQDVSGWTLAIVPR